MSRPRLFFESLEQRMKEDIAEAIKPLMEHIIAAIGPLSECARELDPDDEDTVIYRHGLRSIKLFELGEFVPYTLSRGKGHSSLFISEDGNFYQYGPHYSDQSNNQWWSSIGLGVRVTFKITPLPLESMSYSNVVQCHELTARPWLA